MKRQHVQATPHKMRERRLITMEENNDMELTPERASRIEELLIRLYEDQYQCKLVRTSQQEATA